MTRFALSDLSADMQQQAREQLGLSMRHTGSHSGDATDIAANAPRESLSGKRKYRNQPVEIDGKRFDSKLEGRCYLWLKARWQIGEVSWFTRQIPFELEGGVRYRADFLAVLAGGGVEVIDAKGLLTASSHLKLKQVKARYGFDVILWSDRPKAGM